MRKPSKFCASFCGLYIERSLNSCRLISLKALSASAYTKELFSNLLRSSASFRACCPEEVVSITGAYPV